MPFLVTKAADGKNKERILSYSELSCGVFANAADDLSHAKPPISATCLLDCPHQFEDGFKKVPTVRMQLETG